MKTLDDIIKLAEENVGYLSEKIKELEKLNRDIEAVKESPEKLNEKLKELVTQAQGYTDALGVATKKYVDETNTLFANNLSKLSDHIKEFKNELTRLISTDFNALFNDLQKKFISQTREDLAIELQRFEEKGKDLQEKIDELKKQVDRLQSIDVEKYFDKLQKTLSDIFGAINNINSNLTNAIQTLAGIVQSLVAIQLSVDTNYKELKQFLNSFSETTAKHLTEQDNQTIKNMEWIENKVESLIEQNELLKKRIRTNRVLYVIGLLIISLMVMMHA